MNRELRGRPAVTLRRVFERPRRADIRWTEVEALLISLGALISQGRGSRVRVLLNDTRAVFHRPHPRQEMNKGSVASLERFLKAAGIEPED